MKTIHYLSIIILSFSSQILLAQNDTLVGVLRDISDKIIKRYPVTLGSQNPITVKTNKQLLGMPHVNAFLYIPLLSFTPIYSASP